MYSRKNTLSVCFSILSLGYAWVMVGTYAPGMLSEASFSLQARIINRATSLEDMQWKIFGPVDLDEGVTVPAGTNVVFTLPPDAPEIRREVLFGHSGKEVRYWGYCFDEDHEYEQGKTIAEAGFPGKLFLSEAERKWRAERLRQQKPLYTIYNVPTARDQEPQNKSSIRHQIERFQSLTCYIMAEKNIALGSDRDNDGLNAQEERSSRTEPENPDTDGDGVFDGQEVTELGTDALRRDTDGDGLIDGIEYRTGTSPLKLDSDGDGLCDGFCRNYTYSRALNMDDNLGTQSRLLLFGRWTGEDKNLNGTVDSKETDPRLWSTTQDGVSDMQTYYRCMIAGGNDC